MPATEQIWAEYHSRLAAFVRGRVPEAEVDDLLQDLFLRIHSRIDTLRDETKLESWLYQVTRNTITDHYRTRQTPGALPDWLEQAAPETEANLKQELSVCLEPMISALPDKYRVAVELSEIEGVTQKEVAERQGISLSGAKSRVQRGRALLKSMLNDCCEFELNRHNRLVAYERKQDDCDHC